MVWKVSSSNVSRVLLGILIGVLVGYVVVLRVRIAGSSSSLLQPLPGSVGVDSRPRAVLHRLPQRLLESQILAAGLAAGQVLLQRGHGRLEQRLAGLALALLGGCASGEGAAE